MVANNIAVTALWGEAVQSRRVVPLLQVSTHHLSILVREKINLTRPVSITCCSQSPLASGAVSSACLAAHLKTWTIPSLVFQRPVEESVMICATAGEGLSAGSGKRVFPMVFTGVGGSQLWLYVF